MMCICVLMTFIFHVCLTSYDFCHAFGVLGHFGCLTFAVWICDIGSAHCHSARARPLPRAPSLPRRAHCSPLARAAF